MLGVCSRKSSKGRVIKVTASYGISMAKCIFEVRWRVDMKSNGGFIPSDHPDDLSIHNL